MRLSHERSQGIVKEGEEYLRIFPDVKNFDLLNINDKGATLKVSFILHSFLIRIDVKATNDWVFLIIEGVLIMVVS